MTETPNVANVLTVYRRATFANFSDGLGWYDDAHQFAASLDSDIAKAAGVVAAISPNTSWTANKTMARKAFINGSGIGMGFPDKVRKVTAILEGNAPLDILGGDKVRAFYSTILNPADSNSIPVIDRHAFDIAIGERRTEKTRGALGRKGVYAQFADVYRTAAGIIGIGAPQLQAITWMQWREDNNIVV